eukprot:TRINITY_DN2166_c0_g1_i1.p1 TRINITY_DN2166_c0_g1~~TRINITY_DN2166_c0_g1_i1.p1  ORF type:complete len:237 (+),score=73.53 TRINITY_DN2166_c0_g1_i1:106-816(+)
MASQMDGIQNRQRIVARDDLRRDLTMRYQKLDAERIAAWCENWFKGEGLTPERIAEMCEKETQELVGNNYLNGVAGGLQSNPNTEKNPLILYVSNQTGDRHLRYRCSRLRLVFVCLRIDVTEIDLAGNKWLKTNVLKDARRTAPEDYRTLMDEEVADAYQRTGGSKEFWTPEWPNLPMLFYGTGPEGKWVGDYEFLLNIIDDGAIYEHLAKFGYKHPYRKQKHFVYTGDSCRMTKK